MLFLVGKVLKVDSKDYSIEFVPSGAENQTIGMVCKRLGHITIPPKPGDIVGVLWDDHWTLGFYLPLLNDNTIALKNDRTNMSLKDIVGELIDCLTQLQTIGPPPQHTLSPNTITQLTQIKQKFDQLLDE